jgi:transposase
MTDTLGLLLVVCVMAASAGLRRREDHLLSMYLFTPVRFVYADAGFAGMLVEGCQRILRTVLHIVREAPGQKGFAVIARRWVVERSPAWLTAHCHLARDYERDPRTSEAMIRWAAINGMVRRLTRGGPGTPSASLDPRPPQGVAPSRTLT